MSKKKKKAVDLEKLKRKKEARELEEKKAKKKNSLTMFLVGAVFLLLITFGLIMLFHSEHSAYDTVVFKVGDEKVRKDEINLCMLQNIINLSIDRESLSKKAENGMNAAEYYKQEILELIMNYKVESMIAQKQGITLSKDEEQEVKNDASEYMGKINARVLNELGITKDRITEIYRQRYLAHKLEEKQDFDVEIEEQKFVTIYRLLFPKVVMDEEGDFVTEDDGSTPIMLSDEEIAEQKAKADQAYKELTEENADIEEVAKKYGVDLYSGLQSNLVSNFADPFSKYAEELKDGEYSPVFEIESCYGIVKMINSNNEEIAEQIVDTYKQDREKEELNKQRNKWYQEMGVSKDPVFVGNTWDKISLYDYMIYVE